MRFLLLAPLFFSSYGSAAPAVSLLTPEELAARISELQVVDGRERKDFEKGHVPGSLSLPWTDFTEVRPGLMTWLKGDSAKWGRLAPDAEAEKRLREHGLKKDKPIAVLGDPRDAGAEGRAAWSLLYWGAPAVFLVDGGYSAWAALAKSKPETGKVKPAPGDFVVVPQKERRLLLADVKEALRDNHRSILDARTPSEFTGEKMKGQKRGGHLPRAQLVPVLSLYDEKGRFISADALKALAPKLQDPVTYCTGGVRSALLAVLLEARLGVKAANYDGSMWEYSADPELPLVQ